MIIHRSHWSQANAVHGLARFVLLPGRPFRNIWDILAVLFLVQLGQDQEMGVS
jgi:hypothetical protein